ncbi:MAG: prepilin-type cleavage/methylation domain-containing protein, partial [Planctomycetes bacterium]|nr:prepilin-type cleavage/methylation domain-containing protein [Planctomycetota bacterium]
GVVVAGTSGSLEDSWTLTLTRDGASSDYGAYTVTMTHEGYDTVNSTSQALDDINPVAE